MKRLVRRAVGSIAPAASFKGTRVLLYHSIDEPCPADKIGLRVTPAAFRQQMEHLRSGGWEVVPLNEVFQKGGGERPRVAISFDDGYRSQAGAAAILAEFDFPATFFVVPRFLDGDRRPTHYWEQWDYLDWDELGNLMEAGFEVGAHSMTHTILTECGFEPLREETEGVRSLLQDRTGRNVTSFSYPHGRFDARVRSAVELAGYEMACTSRFGTNLPNGDRLEVRRVDISGTDDLSEFDRKLRGSYDWLGSWHDLTWN